MNRFIRVSTSMVWSATNSLVRKAVSKGLLSSETLDVFTIGIGNLQAGGAGKTPLVRELAREAIRKGFKVVILSRGYRGRVSHSGKILAPGDGPADPNEVGDECALLQEDLPQVWIGVGRDRKRVYSRIRERIRPDLVILDDAFQHWKIKPHRQVLAVTDSTWGDTYFRDFYSSARSADLWVLTKGRIWPKELSLPHPKAELSYKIRPPEGHQFYRFVTSIGDPNRALSDLQTAGYKILSRNFFPDHYPFSRSEIEEQLSEAKVAQQRIVMTGKDWIKWKQLGCPIGEVTVVEPELVWASGKELFSRLLEVRP